METYTLDSEFRTMSHIHIAEDLSGLESLLAGTDSSGIFVVADRLAVGPTDAQCGGLLKRISPHPPIVINATEKDKTLDAVGYICMQLAMYGADRNALMVAIGGGITTDIAGFAASIYKRGIRVAYVPTTLLAQVDAAIGGKNAVNFMGVKNVLGTIRQPIFTYISVQYIYGLPEREIREGLSEMLKTFLIGSSAHYQEAVSIFSSAGSIADIPSDMLRRLISKAVEIKVSIVSRDQFDTGSRQLLNLGHTFAHAIESSTDGEISHGEAVAMGMVLAAKAGTVMGITTACFAEDLETDLDRCSLLVHRTLPMQQLYSIMASDKKRNGNFVNLIIPAAPEDVRICPTDMQELMRITMQMDRQQITEGK